MASDPNIQLPSGYRFAGVACGIKAAAGKRDLSLVVADRQALAVGVYTRNSVVAAPVILCRQRTPSDRVRAIVINSGNANACTGSRGDVDAARMAACVADALGGGARAEQVLVMSTGVIGRFLPMDKVESGIHRAAERLDAAPTAFLHAAEGILTTDQGIKVGCRRWDSAGGAVTITAMAKGAGMIGPNMATMLCCIVTDAQMSLSQADRALRSAVDASFNCISVEGHTSTNDSVVMLGRRSATEKVMADGPFAEFCGNLRSLCIDLAKMIPADGEGATHLVEISVAGAASDEQARSIARTVGSSNLVKTAVYGNDPNWGRIVSAAGYAPVPIDPQRTTLKINGIELFHQGQPVPFDAPQTSRSMKENATTRIELQVGNGPGRGMHWTSDLTEHYVRFNSEYTT